NSVRRSDGFISRRPVGPGLPPQRATSTESPDLGHELSWWSRYASGVSSPRRLGILGGTFDPVHVGHLVAAVNARHELSLDRVLLVVANEPWQKVGTRSVSPAADRLALVEAAVEGGEGLGASGVGVERGGPPLTPPARFPSSQCAIPAPVCI